MSLNSIKKIIPTASILIFVLCVVAAGIIFNETQFDMSEGNAIWTAIGFYFLAKGIFCSLLLYLSSEK